MHYSRNRKRIFIKDDKLCQQKYNDLGEVHQLQVRLHGQFFNVLMQSLHGIARKHPDISTLTPEIRQKFYFPSSATYVTYVPKWVGECEISIHDKRINNAQVISELFLNPYWDLDPEDLMQINRTPEIPPNGVYENIITAKDAFSRYVFASPNSTPRQ